MNQDVRGRAQLFQNGAFNKGPVNARAASIGGDVSGLKGLYAEKEQEEIEINRTGIIPNFFRRLFNIFGGAEEDADMRNSQGGRGSYASSTNSSISSSIYSNADGSGSVVGDFLLLFSIFLFALTLLALALESDPLELLGLTAEESSFALPEISVPSVSLPSWSLPNWSLPSWSLPSWSLPSLTPVPAMFYSGATPNFLYHPYPILLKAAGLY